MSPRRAHLGRFLLLPICLLLVRTGSLVVRVVPPAPVVRAAAIIISAACVLVVAVLFVQVGGYAPACAPL